MQMPSAQQNWKGGVTCERAVIISKEYEENISGKRRNVQQEEICPFVLITPFSTVK